mmetsp:Transcript_78538/g.172160  ORF Transcript_78538/g.172160 Transcript_78538/m.172160 type:complete len:85 (-) Transcript_78538:2-256(-)
MDLSVLPISKDAFEWQCSLLKLGNLNILLNCGWNVGFDTDLLSPLIPHLKVSKTQRGRPPRLEHERVQSSCLSRDVTVSCQSIE